MLTCYLLLQRHFLDIDDDDDDDEDDDDDGRHGDGRRGYGRRGYRSRGSMLLLMILPVSMNIFRDFIH